MIREVTVDETTFASYPTLLEAGTPNVAGAVGMHAALDYLSQLDRATVRHDLTDLSEYASEVLRSIPGVSIVRSPRRYAGIFSITIKDIHPHDVASFLNKDGIAVRAGLHCTQPLLHAIGVPATVRISLSIYNDRSEIDRLRASLIDFMPLIEMS